MDHPLHEPRAPIPPLTDAQLAQLNTDASHFLHDWVRASLRSKLRQQAAQEASVGLLESLIQTLAPKMTQQQAAKAVSGTEKALRRNQ